MSASEKLRFELAAPLSPKAIEAQCHAKGVRMGRQRRAVARIVATMRHPFGFDDIFKEARRIAPAISRGTIYLSLRRFRAAGLFRDPVAPTRSQASGHV
jgi:Fe2+ or Zn2+ uptake regulation protein